MLDICKSDVWILGHEVWKRSRESLFLLQRFIQSCCERRLPHNKHPCSSSASISWRLYEPHRGSQYISAYICSCKSHVLEGEKEQAFRTTEGVALAERCWFQLLVYGCCNRSSKAHRCWFEYLSSLCRPMISFVFSFCLFLSIHEM